jgi:AbrB family looped-hinge helix DNA binding protein
VPKYMLKIFFVNYCKNLLKYVDKKGNKWYYNYIIKMKWRKIMKSTGVVRRIDELGRIVLPIEIRKNLNIGNRDTVEIFVENDALSAKVKRA